jgi:hypothetical protein
MFAIHSHVLMLRSVHALYRGDRVINQVVIAIYGRFGIFAGNLCLEVDELTTS